MAKIQILSELATDPVYYNPRIVIRWLRQSIIEPDFHYSVLNYTSVITREDFASDTETVRKKINQWVEDKTKNKIQDLLQSGSVSSNTKLVLVNAIYFKGNWLTEFDKSKTQKNTFTLESNETVQADMMTLKAEFSHGYFKDVQARVLKVFLFSC